MKKKKGCVFLKKKDFLLGLFLILIFALLWKLSSFGEKGTWVHISLDGKEIGKYYLTESKKEVKIGEGNILTIYNNEAWMSHASCPDKICVKRGRVSRSGEEIICMPNRVIVRVEGGAKEENE